MWRDVLAQAGVTVETVDASHVRLRDGDTQQVVLLRELHYPIAASQIPPTPRGPALLAVPKATARTVDAAARRGWYVVTDAGALSLRLGGRSIEQDSPQLASRSRSRRRGPTSWATFAVVRRLLADAVTSQQVLAVRAGASQSKVSRVLSQLADAGLVERTTERWQPVDWDALLDWWLSNYPGPAGTASYWYSLDDPKRQAANAVSALQHDPTACPVVSGDVAADLLAPWRRPNKVVVYTKSGAPLSDVGFVAVASPDEASLALRAPADPGVWLPTPWGVDGGLALADPLQLVYDVAAGSDSDRDEAVERLRHMLRGDLRSRWRAAVSGSDDG